MAVGAGGGQGRGEQWGETGTTVTEKLKKSLNKYHKKVVRSYQRDKSQPLKYVKQTSELETTQLLEKSCSSISSSSGRQRGTFHW